MTKATFLITDMDCLPEYNEDGSQIIEYPTEKTALKAAKEKLKNSCESEVWVWRLSHVVCEPDVEPIVEVIK
jgi:hypothetical protein